jgi:N6-adenosine-specific RNA methylase IME4
MGEYRTIVADPPWPYSPGRSNQSATSTKGLRAHDHYEAMTLPDICALAPPAAADAHLYLWTTNAFMVEAHEVAEAWGFKPKTICTWVKTCKHDPARVSRKTGHWFRGATEHWLFCVRGSLKLQTAEALPTAYLWPRLPHSVKPDAFYDLVEKASPGDYLELFSRRERIGWKTWGNQSANSAGLSLAA